MGRTVPTYRMTLEELAAQLAPYRRAMSRPDQEAFDSLLEQARLHASASGAAARSNPLDAVLLSILVEHEKRLRGLERR